MMRVASAVDLTSEQDVAAEDVAAEDVAAADAAAETDRGRTSVPALFDTYGKCADGLRTGLVDAVATGNSILSGIAAKSGGAFKVLDTPFFTQSAHQAALYSPFDAAAFRVALPAAVT